MLEIGKANEVKFKVGVNGTKAEPTVRLVIGNREHELGFAAEKLLGGDEDDWYAEVKIPESMAAGEYDFRVEVVVNNRLFTPIKRTVEIGTREPMIAAEEQQPARPTQRRKQTETWEGEGGALPKAPEKPQPLPSKPIDPLKPTPKQTIASRPKSLMKEAAEQDGTELHRPEKKVTPAQPQVVKEQRVPKVKPAPVKQEPIRITLADIAAESEKRFGEVLKESASYKSPAVQVTPINIQHQTPVTLTKGDIVYE